MFSAPGRQGCNKALTIDGIMKWKPAIAFKNLVVMDFYDWLKCFAFEREQSVID